MTKIERRKRNFRDEHLLLKTVNIVKGDINVWLKQKEESKVLGMNNIITYQVKIEIHYKVQNGWQIDISYYISIITLNQNRIRYNLILLWFLF